MKKVLMIFSVVIILSNYVISQSTGEWKTVYSFSGSSVENTDDFIMKKNKWRIMWEAEKQYEEFYGGNVEIKLIDSEGKEELVANTIPPDTGKTIIRKKGKFYFEVLCVLAKWKIEIQESVSK